MGHNNGGSIRRDDECRLLFFTACEGHERPPVWPWRPFGVTKINDVELPVRQHAQCAYCLEYESWEWILTNDRSIQNFGQENTYPPNHTAYSAPDRISAKLSDYNYDFFSQSLSEGATRGIFEWLRSTGYPHCERPIYKHSWIDLEGTDEEEPDDGGSDVEIEWGTKQRHVESWLDGIE